MNRFFAKFGFVHRRLWQQDGGYRAALLFGPPPLIGGLVAFAVWSGVQALTVTAPPPLPWAAPRLPQMWNTEQGEVPTVAPARPLPEREADGRLSGYDAGWRVTANPIRVSPTMEVGIDRTPLLAFHLASASLDMTRLLAKGPKNSLYVAAGAAFLVIQTAGTYGLTARLERPGGLAANCLIRLGFGGRRVVSTLEIAVVDDLAKTFDPARFALQPGLYPIDWVFGCWHQNALAEQGQMTVLLSHPGEALPLPVGPNDIVYPRRVSP